MFVKQVCHWHRRAEKFEHARDIHKKLASITAARFPPAIYIGVAGGKVGSDAPPGREIFWGLNLRGR